MLELIEYAFFRNALLGVIIIGISSAIIGTYIITRRLTAITGGITHACFGGLGLGYYLGMNPVIMASVFAIASSIGVEWLSERCRVREDSAIAVVWALGMAVGVLFVFMTPGYVPELNGFLFGNILTINSDDLWSFAIYTFALIVFLALQYHSVVACAFDADFAKVSGVKVKIIKNAMTLFVAIGIVLTIRLVGIMLLISMLTLPILIAEIYCRRFLLTMIISVGISIVCSMAGLFLATLIEVPCSAMIVMVQVVVYMFVRIYRDTVMRRAMQ